jgi:hypothetical protein
MVYVNEKFENIDEDNVEEWLQSDVCEMGFQLMTDVDIANAAMKQREKKKDKAVSVSVIAWHYNVLTLLDYMGQRGFEYSDITATRKVHTSMRRSLN